MGGTMSTKNHAWDRCSIASRSRRASTPAQATRFATFFIQRSSAANSAVIIESRASLMPPPPDGRRPPQKADAVVEENQVGLVRRAYVARRSERTLKMRAHVTAFR